MLKIPSLKAAMAPFQTWLFQTHGGSMAGAVAAGCQAVALTNCWDGHHPVIICGHPSEMFRVTANPAAAKIQVTAVETPTTPDRLDHT
jgi:hypothetical protein